MMISIGFFTDEPLGSVLSASEPEQLFEFGVLQGTVGRISHVTCTFNLNQPEGIWIEGSV